MPKKEPTKNDQIDALMENLKKAMKADIQAGKMVLNAGLRKKKSHYELQLAQQAINDFKSDHC